MDMRSRKLRQMLWEARMMYEDPYHPINDRRHPKHEQAVAALRLIEEEGRRLLNKPAPRSAES